MHFITPDPVLVFCTNHYNPVWCLLTPPASGDSDRSGSVDYSAVVEDNPQPLKHI